MKQSDFIKAVTAYYGGFDKQEVFGVFMASVKKIAESDLDRILEWLHVNIGSNWKLDAKVLHDACIACGVQMRATLRTCPVCGTSFSGTGLCPECLFNPLEDGEPETYRQTYISWKTDKNRMTEQVQSILASFTLNLSEKIQQQEKLKQEQLQ